MKLGWLSDIHLNFLDEVALRKFLDRVASHPVDGWLVSGDIGEADSVVALLRQFEAAVHAKIFFVLGNHDFYGGSLSSVRADVLAFVEQSDHLVWLTHSEHQLLGDAVVVMGDDSWGDARFGDAEGSAADINDFYLIKELTGLSRRDIIRTLNDLGDASAARLYPKLCRAARLRRRVVVVTHVPPFKEAAWYGGKPSSDEWLAWFSCKAVGDAIVECARSNPETDFLVLSGHTHGAGTYSPARNVTVRTASATYGSPRIQKVFEFGEL